MLPPRDKVVRHPAVAGRFYPAQADQCRAMAQQYLREAEFPKSDMPAWGAIVPHAGWICSGAIAAQALAALAANRADVDLVVIFGAIHTPIQIDRGVFDSHDFWNTPTGDCSISMALRDELAANQKFITDDRFHQHEHAVEVELPLVRECWPNAGILPVETPPIDQAIQIGRDVATAVIRGGLRAVYLASSDLTHYGPAYNFTPAGVGDSALQWSLENDRRILQLVSDMTPGKIISEARNHHNSCGPGAIAAMMAACEIHGATKGKILRHANSYQTLARISPQRPDNAVGYAAVLVA